MKGKWNDIFLTELEIFPDAFHDDQVDAARDAFVALANIGVYSAPPNEKCIVFIKEKIQTLIKRSYYFF